MAAIWNDICDFVSSKTLLGTLLAVEENRSQWEPFGAIFEIRGCSEALLGSQREPRGAI